MTRARKKRLPAHGFFPSGLYLIQDENPASRADGGLVRLRQPLPYLGVFHKFNSQTGSLAYVRAMDF